MQQLAALPPPVGNSEFDSPILRTDGSNASARKKALVLEDDPAFLEIMKVYLEGIGFNVVAVMNGMEGVHEVLAGDFDIILSDIMMPTLPGDSFFRAVERMRPHLAGRFVFMTGHCGNAKVKEYLQTVRGTVLRKPFQVDDLLEVIVSIQHHMAAEAAT